MRDFLKQIITAKTHGELTSVGYSLTRTELNPNLKSILRKVHKQRKRKLNRMILNQQAQRGIYEEN